MNRELTFLHNVPSILEHLLEHRFRGKVLVTTSRYGDEMINDNATYVGCNRNNTLNPFHGCESKFSKLDLSFFDLDVFVKYGRTCKFPDCDTRKIDHSNHMCVPGPTFDAAKAMLQHLVRPEYN